MVVVTDIKLHETININREARPEVIVWRFYCLDQ